MSFARSFLATVLLVAAVGAALLGVGSQWLGRTARTPEPMREFVGTVSSDDAIIDAIATEMESQAVAAIPEITDYVPGLRAEMEALLRRGIALALENEALNAAWFASVDETRMEAVAGLDAMRENHGSAPLVTFSLRPFIELGTAQLYELSDAQLHPILDQMNLTRNVEIPLGVLPAQPAHWAAEGLGVAEHWRWHYVVAVVLGVAGFVLGSRRGRWVALLFALGFGIVAQAAVKIIIAEVSVPAGSSVAATLRARIFAGATESLVTAVDRCLIITGFLTLAAVIGLTVVAIRSDQARIRARARGA